MLHVSLDKWLSSRGELHYDCSVITWWGLYEENPTQSIGYGWVWKTCMILDELLAKIAQNNPDSTEYSYIRKSLKGILTLKG